MDFLWLVSLAVLRHVRTPFVLRDGKWVDPFAHATHLLDDSVTNFGSFGRALYGNGPYGVQR
jgi:hypothetical protein